MGNVLRSLELRAPFLFLGREGDAYAKIKVNSRNRLYWSYFLDENGKIRYNKTCRQCAKDCKQSFRSIIVCCPFYEKKGVKKA